MAKRPICPGLSQLVTYAIFVINARETQIQISTQFLGILRLSLQGQKNILGAIQVCCPKTLEEG